MSLVVHCKKENEPFLYSGTIFTKIMTFWIKVSAKCKFEMTFVGVTLKSGSFMKINVVLTQF